MQHTTRNGTLSSTNPQHHELGAANHPPQAPAQTATMPGAGFDHPAPIVEVRDLEVHFRSRRALRAVQTVKAVDGVSFTIAAGETFGLAGESGSGKSTIARTLVRINRPTAGSVRVAGEDTAGDGTRRSSALPAPDADGLSGSL